jgi:NAD(P)H-dependent flavin oxidoreductase YrpB (nitropropane dioxygenase family)
MPLTTKFTELVKCEHPIQLAPMGAAGSPRLIAAVAQAGGHAMMPGTLVPPPALVQALDGLRTGVTAFGVNFLVPVLNDEALELAAERAPLVELFFGPPDAARVARIHNGGALASWQVGSLDEARAAADAGCDLIVVQGAEAGGRLRGSLGLIPLLAEVLDAVDVPVVAAGGIATARGVAAVLAAGAAAARLGTRFLATTESGAHPLWIDRVVAARGEDTVVSEAFTVFPQGLGTWAAPKQHRVLRSAVDAAERLDREVAGTLPIGDATIELPRFAIVPPPATVVGAVEAMALYAGQSAGSIREVSPAGEIVKELASGAADLLARHGAAYSSSST